MALEDMFGMGGGPEKGDEPAGEEMGMEIEIGEEAGGEDDLKAALQDLIDNWNPTTPEGERYLDDLEKVMSQHFGGGMEEEEQEDEGEIVEGAEYDEADEEPPEEGGPTMGFDIVAMRKRAAKNAMGGE